MKLCPSIFALTLTLTMACGSSDKADSEGGGSGECATYGEQVAASDLCEEDAEVYATSCEEGSAEAATAGCGVQSDAYLACANTAGYEYDCSDDGEPSVEWTEDDPCEDEISALLACAFGA
jgi:hypothetical protein